jgi:hypothetical protein
MATIGDPLGCDIYCTTGFPLVMRLCWGEENLQAASLRRLSSDDGCLESIGDDPSYGYNVGKQLNKSFDRPGDMAAVGARSMAELEKDERIVRVRARVIVGEGG